MLFCVFSGSCLSINIFFFFRFGEKRKTEAHYSSPACVDDQSGPANMDDENGLVFLWFDFLGVKRSRDDDDEREESAVS